MTDKKHPPDLLAAVDAFRSKPGGYRLRPGECAYCDRYRNDRMMPSHTASPRCESGKRPHCTCDTCY